MFVKAQDSVTILLIMLLIIMSEPFYFKRYDTVIGKAENIAELRKELERLRIEDPLAVLYHIKEGHISIWLASMGKKDLAEAIKPSMTIEETIKVISGPATKVKGRPREGQHEHDKKQAPRKSSHNNN
jgi:hypothetical protein